jgi:hypothetical protein
MSWVSSWFRKGKKVKFGSPLSEVGALMLTGMTLDEAVKTYGKNTIIKNIGREKIQQGFIDIRLLISEDNRFKAIEKVNEIEKEILG